MQKCTLTPCFACALIWLPIQLQATQLGIIIIVQRHTHTHTDSSLLTIAYFSSLPFGSAVLITCLVCKLVSSMQSLRRLIQTQSQHSQTCSQDSVFPKHVGFLLYLVV